MALLGLSTLTLDQLDELTLDQLATLALDTLPTGQRIYVAGRQVISPLHVEHQLTAPLAVKAAIIRGNE